MSRVGYQDFWVTGSNFRFRRDPIGGVKQPWNNFGVIQGAANPSLAPSSVELKDPDGGKATTVEKGLSSIAETYDVTFSSLSLRMLSNLFLGGQIEEIVRAASVESHDIELFPGHLARLVDAQNRGAHTLRSIGGVWLPLTAGSTPLIRADEIVGFDAPTQTIITQNDPSTFGLNPGDRIIASPRGTTAAANASNVGTYVVNSINGPAKTISVAVANAKTIATTETGRQIDLMQSTGAAPNDVTILAEGIDWALDSLDRGYLRMLPGSILFPLTANPADGGSIYELDALTGERRFNAQETSEITGYGEIYWSQEENNRQTRRDFRCSIQPVSTAFSDTEFSSQTLQISVIEDQANDPKFGSVTTIKGAPADRS